MTIEQAARNFFAWFNRHYPAPSNHPDHEWNRLGAALAEPMQPHDLLCVCGAEWDIYPDGREELVATPPQRKPLTEEQIFSLRDAHAAHLSWGVKDFARAIEAAHGIKEQE